MQPDRIQMSPFEAFRDAEAYYSTMVMALSGVRSTRSSEPITGWSSVAKPERLGAPTIFALSCTISAQLCVRYRLGFSRQLKASWRNMADPQLLSFT
jgi:antirestriction protein ArdC